MLQDSEQADDLRKLTLKNSNSSFDRIASLDERVGYWLRCEESWFFKQYVKGEIAVVLDLHSVGKFS